MYPSPGQAGWTYTGSGGGATPTEMDMDNWANAGQDAKASTAIIRYLATKRDVFITTRNGIEHATLGSEECATSEIGDLTVQTDQQNASNSQKRILKNLRFAF